MKRIIFPVLVPAVLLLSATSASPVSAGIPAYLWSQRFGGVTYDFGNSVAVDGAGNVFITGEFTGTVDFGGGNLVSAGGRDIFIAKYNAGGVHQWSERFGGALDDSGLDIAVDGLGNVIVTGYFRGSVDFGGGSLPSMGAEDIFLAKYDTNGTQQWSRSFGGTLDDEGRTVAVGVSGSVFMSGLFRGTVDFGGGGRVSAGDSDIFLCKYDAGGTHQWSQRFGGTNFDYANAVATDGSENVVMTGSFYLTADFGGGPLVASGASDVVLAKYDANGAHMWSQHFGGASLDVAQNVTVDNAGNVFITGAFMDTSNFGGSNLSSAGGWDIFLAKYDAGGTHQWSQRFGGPSDDAGFGVAPDGFGNVLATGYSQGTVDFGGGGIVGQGDYNMFLTEYDANGTHISSQTFGVGICTGNAIEVDESGNAILIGAFAGVADFGGGLLVSASSLDFDVCLAKYASLPAEPVITSITDIGNDQGRKVRIRFSRSGNDQAAATEPILAYEAYRRDDAPPAGALVGRSPAGLSERELLDEGWTQVGAVSAHAATGYGIDVPTVGDSTVALGQYYSVFYIRAATGAPSRFYDSAPDSGYSVDNLAPGVPGGLLYNSGLLSWNESRDEDFDYFTVYGANVDAFGSATIVDYSVAPTMDVTAAGYAYYFVTATDFSGNEGKAARINTLSDVGGTPKSYVLSVSNFPNPFNPNTTVSYTVPSRGNVTVVIYDARGARVATLVNNETRDAGAYRLEWAGRDDSGLAVPSGIYFARIVQGDAVRSRKMVLLK